MENPDNSGLDVPIDALIRTATFYQNQLTRADIWALAATTAANEMQRSGNVPYRFDYYGRETCGDMEGGPDIAMPSNHVTTDDLLDFFSEEFGFTNRETVAIMGAHTL